MSKFKKGDRVKVIKTNSPYNANIATISCIYDQEWRGQYIYELSIDERMMYCESDLELITEPKTLENLVVGDMIIGDNLIQKVTNIEKLYTTKHGFGTSQYTLKELKEYGYKPFTKPTTVIDGKTYILNDKLAKAIEEAEII